MTHELATSDQALDPPTCEFQQCFRTYLPLYNDYTGSSLSLENDIQRPYDSLREIDFARLADVADTCITIADDFEEQLEDVNNRVGTVNGWTGNAADAFRGYLQQFQTGAQKIDEDLEAIADSIGEAVSAGRRVISDYVDAIGDIDFSGFDQPGHIQFMIDVERLIKPVGDVISALLDWLGDLIGVVLPLPGGHGGLLGMAEDLVMDAFGDVVDWILDTLGFSVDGFLVWIAGKVREYLDASFKGPFDTNLHLLHDAVAAATTGIQDAFQPMIYAATAVAENPFAALPVPPVDDPDQPPASQPPGGTRDSSAPDGSAAAGSMPGGTPPVASPASDAPTGSPTDLRAPKPDELPVGGRPGGADGHGGDARDLPAGAGWIADPSRLPPGWTIDPESRELLPPGGPGDAGVPDVHSAADHDVLHGGDGLHPRAVTDQAAGADGGPTSVSIRDGDLTVTVPADRGPDDGIQVTVTESEGHRAEYAVKIGDGGRPELVPIEPAGAATEPATEPATVGPPAGLPIGVTPGQTPAATVPAAVGFAGTADPAFASADEVSGELDGGDRGRLSGVISGGGHGAASGAVWGGPSFVSSGHSGSVSDGGQVMSGSVGAVGAGHGANPGGAQLASASDPGAGGPGGARLASVGDDPHGHSGAAVPMMPLTGAVSGGDDERRGGWQAPAGDLFDADFNADEASGQIHGVLGADT
jgi:WXG100 family type VII secretion target